MKSIFLDTVGMLALWDRRDQWHRLAMPVFIQLLSQRVRFVTSELVLVECANAASRTAFRSEVTDFRNQMLDAGGVISISPADLNAAWTTFQEGVRGQPGVVDLVSFGIMRDYGIIEAFTNDQHFRAAGFVTLF